MNRKRFGFVLFIGLVGFGAIEGEVKGEEVRLSLEEAMKRAEVYALSLMGAQIDVEEGDATVQEAYASALPKVNLNALSGRYMISPETYIPAFNMRVRFMPTNDITSQLTLDQPLWLGGKVGLALQAAKVYRQLARQSQQVEKSRVRSAVVRGYFGLALSRQVLQVMEESYLQAERHRQLAEAFFQQGVISEYDLLRAETSVRSLEPEVEKAHQAVKLAETALKHYLGLKPEDTITLTDSLSLEGSVGDISLPDALNTAAQRRGEYQIADLNLNLRQIALKVEQRSIYWPNFFLNFTYQWRVAEDRWANITPDRWSNEFRWQVVMSIPLFDGFATPARVEKAKLGIRRAHLQKQMLAQGIELEVTQIVSEIQRARRHVESQRAAVQLSEKAYQIAMVRYEQGVGTEMEVQDARIAWERARLGYLQGIYDLKVAQAEFERAVLARAN